MVAEERGGMVAVRFVDRIGKMQQKTISRADSGFAEFGRHTSGTMPAGVEQVASSTRPGCFAYFEASTRTKYATPELAWQAFLQRADKIAMTPKAPAASPAPA